MKQNFKTIQEAASQFDLENEFDFFNYIIESYINGQKKQFKTLLRLFLSSCGYEDRQTLQTCIINASNVFGLDRTIKILKSYNDMHYPLNDNTIINAFHDNSRSELNEVKTILLNLNNY